MAKKTTKNNFPQDDGEKLLDSSKVLGNGTILIPSAMRDNLGINKGSTVLYFLEKEFDGDLIHELSAEFTGNADQITYVVPSGKTFYHIKSKLYPVVDTVKVSPGPTLITRRADVELKFDTTVKDVLTHDFHSISTAASDPGVGGANTGQYESNISESFVGDGAKSIKLTSTNTSGTYRVSLMGWIEDT